ncbi:glycosyltransferase [Reinekea marinisedimentorum]|uniref:Glycosyltransferase involved in cell wall biosynthesis n=1 Tax=Reinekea marinisedimentorum TaxID=230495 RepID=A0A4V6NY44_9GAMM|nr:glycosyltransferase [Reinekea marinisedimentorum]TCS42376.1 glycosyltransferase involved in cell wall biosynthesis [Reinekea marinisedimentorum]
MKTIGYVLGDFPVLSETFIGNEMRALQDRGFGIAPFAFASNPEQGQPIDKPLAEQTQKIIAVPTVKALAMWGKNAANSARALSFVQQQTGLPKKSLIKSAGQLAYLASQANCSHLHAHFALHTAATAIVAAKLLGCTVSFVGHGFDVYVSPTDLALKLQHASFAVAVCEDMQQLFQQLAPKQQVPLIPCGIDPSRYELRTPASHNQRLLFIGRLAEKKGLPDLLSALAMMPEKNRPGLDIVGDGPLREQLQQQIQALGLKRQVQLLGAKPAEWFIENAASYAALCAPFCKAENGDRDTGPLVVKEAMALGLPVICSEFMGCREILTEDSGTFTLPNAPYNIASAIEKNLAFTAAERNSLIHRARMRVTCLYSCEISALKMSLAIQGHRHDA